MSYVDVKYHKNKIHVWFRENGRLIKKERPAPFYCYIKHLDGDHRSMFGDPVKKVSFNKFWDYKNFVENHSDLFESDISSEYKYLSDNFYGFNAEEPLNIGFYDIETHPHLERGKSYPTPFDPHGEVLSISLFILFENRYHFFYLFDREIDLEDDFEGLEVVHHRHSREIDMLMDFVNTIKNVDALADWNGEQYDIPYLINRMKRVIGEEYALTALCRDGFKAFERIQSDEYGNENLKYDLVGRAHFDMMQLYKKFEENKMSHKLNTIAEEELGADYMKVDYEGTIQDFYENDPVKFFRYSLVDTQILKWLHEKKQHIDLAVQMCRSSTVKYKDALGSVKIIEMGIRNYAHYDLENPVVIVDSPQTTKNEKIEGAYVFPTRIGRCGWGFSADMKQLYPSTICALNISPETFMFQCTRRQDDFFKVVQEKDEEIILESKVDNSYISTTGRELRQFIKEANLTISGNGSLFTNDFVGLVPSFIKTLMSSRAYYKKLMGQAYEEGNKAEGDKYNVYQATYKEKSNSTYGCLSSMFSRFFDADIGQSITISGQHINRFQAVVAEEIIREAINL